VAKVYLYFVLYSVWISKQKNPVDFTRINPILWIYIFSITYMFFNYYL